MKVELLYFDDCPNWKEAAVALQQALNLSLHHNVRVDLVRVETQEQAEARGFVGSPTVLIDGRDPFATGAEQFGLACRVFRTAEGLAGSRASTCSRRRWARCLRWAVASRQRLPLVIAWRRIGTSGLRTRRSSGSWCACDAGKGVEVLLARWRWSCVTASRSRCPPLRSSWVI